MKFRKFTIWFLVMIIACFAIGCGAQDVEDDNPNEFDPDANLVTELTFFDDFTDIDFSKKEWHLSNRKWGSGFNNGVKAENVAYTDDGVLILSSHGDYYNGPLGEEGIRSGAVIISDRVFGPGRFEVRMKAMPRFGATSAIWTYFYGDADGQHDLNQEIDIELNVDNDFGRVWNTSWHTTDLHASAKVDSPVINNDGEWHTYKIEWHTNPERIDYYIDDIVTYTSTSCVPWCAGNLWIGNWFPPSWAGTPNFATDYMFIDYVKYTPYKNNPFTETESDYLPEGEWPNAPIDDIPLANLISDAGFEGCVDIEADPWAVRGSNTASVVKNEGINYSVAMVVTKNSITYEGVPVQEITGMNEGFELTLKANAKLSSGAKGYIQIDFKPLDQKKLGEEKLYFDISDIGCTPEKYYEKELTFTVPKDCKRLEICLVVEEGNIAFDDLFLCHSKFLK